MNFKPKQSYLRQEMAKRLGVEFYFDVMSPYTYFAFQVLKRYASLWKLEVRLIPFNLGGIMKGSGNTPPAMVANKAVFLSNDLTRNAKWFNVEKSFKGMPSNFFAEMGKHALVLNRLLAVLMRNEALSESSKWRAVDTAFSILWEASEYRKGSEFLADSGALVSDFLMRSSINEPIDVELGKRLLKENTEEALELGAFGSPIMRFPNSGIDENIFFGSDRFEQIAFIFGLIWQGPSGPKLSRL